MSKQNLFYLIIFNCLLSANNFAQTNLDLDDLVITATKFPTEKNEIAKPIYVISKVEIEHQQAATLPQLLNQIPNLHIAEAYGNSGSVLNYSLRGSKPKDVLILVNGLPMNDASQISNFEDLNLIPVEAIKKIEVIAGGSSTLYGSGASAGVINIILKDTFLQPAIVAKLQAGKWGSFEQAVQLTGITKDKKLGATLRFRNFSTNGFSAAIDTMGNHHFDKDEAMQKNVSLSLDFQPSKKLNVQLFGQVNNSNYDFDGGAFTDSDDKQENSKQSLHLSSNYEHKLGSISIKASTNSYERETRNSFGLGPNDLSAEYRSNNSMIDLFNHIAAFENTIITTGVFLHRANADIFDGFTGSFKQTISSDSTRHQISDAYASIAMNEIQNLSVLVGTRFHTHNEYQSEFVYNINAKYAFPVLEGEMRAMLGTNSAFITPSLYQLYSPFGNQTLLPEETITFEAGLSYEKGDFSIQTNYFQRKEDNLIGFSNTTFSYANITGESEAEGVEAQVMWKPSKAILTKLFFAKTKRSKEEDFYRLPNEEFGLSANISLPKSINLNTQFRSVGERLMPLFNFTTFETDIYHLDAYFNVDATISKTIFQEQLNLYLAGKNLFNAEIIDNLGYSYQSPTLSIGATFRY